MLEVKGTFDKVGHFKLEAPENAGLNDYVRAMHTENGLWVDCEKSSDTIPEMLRSFGVFLEKAGAESAEDQRGNVMLGGNSVHFDHGFLMEWPEIAKYLHYRKLDVRTLITAVAAWGETPLQVQKPTIHRARADCDMSLATLRAMREVLGGGLTPEDR